MKNKRILLLVILINLCSISVQGFAQDAYTIFNKKGKKVSLKDIMKSTKGKSHIVFGEFHNNPIAHWLQLEMVKSLYDEYGNNLTIGAEMFESDVQLLIDEYFLDKIKQKSFEEEARLWKNYQTDYKPLLEFTKRYGLQFIATNIPRRYANSVFYNGIEVLHELSDQAKRYIAPLPISVDTTLNSYRKIKNMVSGHNGDFLMEAQAVKDATMAHFILMNSKEGSIFFHLNGAYHSNNYEGIISFLTSEVPLQKILTLTTISQDDINRLEEDNYNLADFIICINSDMTLTH